MEYGLEMNAGEATLRQALAEWNHTEDLFRKHFGEASLGDRDFRKMKLKEYDRMWYSFNGRPLTKDERALMRMLRFQRRKIRRTLYRGLLGRLWNRTVNFLSFLAEPKEMAVPRQDASGRYAGYAIRVDGEQDPGGQSRQEARQRYQPKYRHSPDIGRRKPQDNGLGKGRSV